MQQWVISVNKNFWHILTKPNVVEMSAPSMVPKIPLITFPLHLPHYISHVIKFLKLLVGSPPRKGFRTVTTIYVAYKGLFIRADVMILKRFPITEISWGKPHVTTWFPSQITCHNRITT